YILSRFKRKLFPAKEMLARFEDLRYEIRRSSLLEKMLHSEKSGVSSEKYCDHEVVVSLTSYGKRLYEVGITIESIMQQSMLPNRIILNLYTEDVAVSLPIALQRQIKRGLEVHLVSTDIRSYKKLIPTLKRFPDAVIITIDDDCIYEYDLVERLFNSYLKNPHSVSAVRTHSILLDKNGKPLPYHKWDSCSAYASKGNRLFFTGVGGVLYPPGAFNDEVFNEEAFMSLAPYADDVWFHAMALLNGTSIVKAPAHSGDDIDHIENSAVQDIGLVNRNCNIERENDKQIKAIYDRYDIYPLLK
ncbi:MAG: hypothetical protein K2H18_00750, partial [Muribaculaceae bacterium]|nr:hypothetical protein [Muribaculaceae bacterium]